MVAVGRWAFVLTMGLFGGGGGGGGSKRVLNDGGSPPPGGGSVALVPLIQDLRSQILRLHGEFLSADGARVDYRGLVASEAFGAYTATARRLQWADPEAVAALAEGERRAAWLNLYNALVMHALAVGPVPASSLARTRFYASTAYRVAGQLLSLDDLEHGLLRDDRASPNPLRWGFWSPRHFLSASDPRRAWAVSLDPRVHFALNCGAASCPAVRYYEAASLQADLDGAAQAFLAGTQVDAAARSLTLSVILKWYQGDFAVEAGGAGAGPNAAAAPGASAVESRERAMLRRIAPWLPEGPGEGARAAVEGWLADGGPIQVRYAPYDWGLNAT